jgi:hypothetical protein
MEMNTNCRGLHSFTSKLDRIARKKPTKVVTKSISVGWILAQRGPILTVIVFSCTR